MEEITILAAGRQLKLSGTHETYLQLYRDWDATGGALTTVTKDLPHGALCFDVGANIGMTAIPLAVQRPDCRIVAFEPVPDNARCLRANIQANGIENVEVVEAAISDRHGTTGMTSSGPWSHVTDQSPLRCRVIPLDDYADQPVDFMKIDAEGHEPHVLAGGRRLLATRRPLIFVEFNAIALVMTRSDPLALAEAIFASFEVLGVYSQDWLGPTPESAALFVYQNVIQHGCVNDLLLRPRSSVPDIYEMTEPPAAKALRDEIRALRASTSWRLTSPLRAVARATIKRSRA
jgi:FkbM family methyltransferase